MRAKIMEWPDVHIGHNQAHLRYAMDCAEFEFLVKRSGGYCDRCGNQMRKPEFDHDHLIGRHAVRGFICHRCNIILGRIERGHRPLDAVTEEYFSKPFYSLIPEVLAGYRPPTFNGNEEAQRNLALRYFVPRPNRATDNSQTAEANSPA